MPTPTPTRILDANEAVARIAHLASEVIVLYPITPSSPMGEVCDAWSLKGKTNLFGVVPEVVQMQSEGGVAGAVHGALQGGALTTTFTASQGLLLMLPDMFKIAGELTPAVFHVAARAIATHALSIFGDHSDVMTARMTGWAMLCSSSVQEAQDFALLAHAVTLQARIPFLHFFDGFRTSHEMNRIEVLEESDLLALLDDGAIRAHRTRALDPDHPVLRGSAQNPDVFFQSREAANPYYRGLPALLTAAMETLAERTGRRYGLVDYVGAPDAERVVVLMGSGAGAAAEAVEALGARGEKVGLLKVRLFRPFPSEELVAALPGTVRTIAVLDRTKEPGSAGEPLFQDVLTAVAEHRPGMRVIGGRYGLASKEFTPSMVAAVFREAAQEQPQRRFTIGIRDDLTHLSLAWDPAEIPEPAGTTRAVFYGLGSDGTVGATKNTVKILGEQTPLFAQGYFVYDSKKSGSVTVSHLRFGKRPIHSSYLVQKAGFIACHQFNLLEKMDVLATAERGATLLLQSPHSPEGVWGALPAAVRRTLRERRMRLFVIDAHAIARETGLGGRINTIMQTCFFALSGVLPREEAIAAIKRAITKSYGHRSEALVHRNHEAVDRALAALHEVPLPDEALCEAAPPGPHDLLSRLLRGEGELLPVSMLPPDGTFPLGTARIEKRGIASTIPIWRADLCIECALCALVCPHAAIRTKRQTPAQVQEAPEAYRSREGGLTVQVAPDDCTGCGVCVDVCPARSKEAVKTKAINMEAREEHLERERENWAYFVSLPGAAREAADLATVKGTQQVEPLFEFSGACAGCGETPYLKLLTQLFGDRMLVANATGCSSIYGGNLPTTPWSVDADGRGPAWSNSLFEDNAEFGLGMRLAVDAREAAARRLIDTLGPRLDADLVRGLLKAEQTDDAGIRQQRERVARLRQALAKIPEPSARALEPLAAALVRRSVWIVGGDGWAYDIGFGGLDHVLASGRDVNVLVLDTEVYSNTGGQASKATPRAAVAKFAAGGKKSGKKDLGMIASGYGNVYVASIALGAHPNQTIEALREAESWRGPSLVIAYSQCIAHGIDMTAGMQHQREAVQSGYWPLYRYDPRERGEHATPLHLDSRKPTLPFSRFAAKQARFAMLAKSDPEEARRLFDLAQRDIDERRRYYEQMANVERTSPDGEASQQEKKQ